jgi:hypothetical protein
LNLNYKMKKEAKYNFEDFDDTIDEGFMIETQMSGPNKTLNSFHDNLNRR